MRISHLLVNITRLSLVLGVVFLAAACDEEKPPPPKPRFALVIEANPQEVALSAEASGRVEARNTSLVGFQVSGRILSRVVDVGSVVKKGQLIAKIDPKDYQNQVDGSQSQVAAARASVTQTQAQERRYAKLLKDGYTTQALYDESKKNLETAQANLAAAEANLRTSQNQLKYTVLVAPVDGVVTKTGADAGQVVQAGQTVVEIAQHTGRDAVFSVSSARVGLARLGMPVKVWPQDKPKEIVVGKLREISPTADDATGTYTVKVGLPDKLSTEFRIGTIIVGRVEGKGRIVTRLPSTALLQTGDKAQVWVVTPPDNTVKKVPVTVEVYNANDVLISKGLKKGDLVVVAGVNILTDGQKVRIQKTDVKKATSE